MKIEYLLYIVFPIVIAFLGERYKDMGTAKYAVLISSILFLAFLIIILIDGGMFVSIKFLSILSISIIFLSTFLFHMQKRERKQKEKRHP